MDNDQIKKIIESCHLNFLIGSGASRPFLGTLGEIENLLSDLADKEESDEKVIVEASIKRHYYDVAIRGNLKLTRGKSDELIETKKAYKDFIESINTILIKRKSNLVSKQVNLFTTNMDLFLEHTIEDAKITYNDGFTGRINPVFGTENFHNSIRKTSTHNEYQSELPLFNLFKLHGSLNWKQQKDKIIYNNNLLTLKTLSRIKFEDEDWLVIADENECFSVEELYDQVNDRLLEQKDEHLEFIEEYDSLVMINPTKEKFATTTRNFTFYELLRMYSNLLERENSVLFVFGFSFADEHIKEITKRVALSNPTLIIIIFAYDKKSKKAIEKELPERSNINIIYDETDEFNYSLEGINQRYFKSIADELLNGKDNGKS